MTRLRTEAWTIDAHGPVYAYLPDDLRPDERLPLVLDMNCTTGNPRAEVLTNGWDVAAARNRLVVVAPTYDDYVTYPEASYMVRVVDEATSHYHTDPARVYATGFSNGGALCVALASEAPERFAAISAAGWMVGARHTGHGYQMPFQVLQGTEEYTRRNRRGDREVMNDEKRALAGLFAMNGMDRGRPDYRRTPYWGYEPDRTRVIQPEYTDYDPYGRNPQRMGGVSWTVGDYYRKGCPVPFAQLVLIDGAGHIPHDYHAAIAWEFFRHFGRDADGSIRTL